MEIAYSGLFVFREITKVLMKNKATQETDVAEDLGREDRHR